MNPKIPPKLFLDAIIVSKVCKQGQFAFSCKYLAVGAHGFICVKLAPQMKEVIDQMTNMIAKGDNCSGFRMLSGLQESMN